MKLVIQRYTREAGVRNLERNLAALARAAAVRVAEQEQAVPLSKDMHRLASPLLENRLADGAEVEMEVIPMNDNNHELSPFRVASPLVVDEAMLEKVLGVNNYYLSAFPSSVEWLFGVLLSSCVVQLFLNMFLLVILVCLAISICWSTIVQ